MVVDEYCGCLDTRASCTSTEIIPYDVETDSSQWLDKCDVPGSSPDNNHSFDSGEDFWFWPQFFSNLEGVEPISLSVLEEITVIANCLCANHLYEEAFVLYHAVLDHLIRTTKDVSCLMYAAVIGCARTCRTFRQADVLIALCDGLQSYHADRTEEIYTLCTYLGNVHDQIYEEGPGIDFKLAIGLAMAMDPPHMPVTTNSPGSSHTEGSYLRHFQTVLELEDLSDQERDLWFSRDISHDIQGRMEGKNIPRRLFEWCARSISTALSLDEIPGLLPTDPSDARELLEQILFCHFMGRWLQEEGVASPLADIEFERIRSDVLEMSLALPESLLAVASVMAGGWLPPLIKGSMKSQFESVVRLRRDTEARMDLITTCEDNFTEAYLRRFIMPVGGRDRSPSRLSRQALKAFAMKLVSSEILVKQTISSPTFSDWLAPSTSEIRGRITDVPSSCPLSIHSSLTPSSSISSFRSFRRFAKRLDRLLSRNPGRSRSSLFSLSTGGSKAPSLVLSAHSRGSWQFGLVTGMKRSRNLSASDNEDWLTRAMSEDEVMLDV